MPALLMDFRLRGRGLNVHFGSETDIDSNWGNVRFTPESRHRTARLPPRPTVSVNHRGSPANACRTVISRSSAAAG